MRKFLTYIAILSAVLFFSVSFGQSPFLQPTQDQIRAEQRKIEEDGLKMQKKAIDSRNAMLRAYYQNERLADFPNNLHISTVRAYALAQQAYVKMLTKYVHDYENFLDKYFPNYQNSPNYQSSPLEKYYSSLKKYFETERARLNLWAARYNDASDIRNRYKYPNMFFRTFPSPVLPERPGSQTWPADSTKLPPGVPRDYLRERSPDPAIQYDLLWKGLRRR